MTENALSIPVCQLDENGYFVGMTTAPIDPLENDGSYLVPRLCIVEKPPEIKSAHVAQWQGDKWQYIEDHRGETVYHKGTGKPIIISELGALSENLTACKPLPYTEWEEKENAWVEVANADKLRLNDKKIQAGTLDRSQLLTQIELEYGKNKEELIKIAEQILTEPQLIRVRNAIIEAQTFTLINDDMWDFLTHGLNIKETDLFSLWESAKKHI